MADFDRRRVGTRRMKTHNATLNTRSLLIAVACAWLAVAGGCSSMYTSSDTLTTAAIDDAPAAAMMAKPKTLDERAAEAPMQAEQFATLGYRVDWRGFASVLPGGQGELFELLGDAVGYQDTAGVLTVLDARSGQSRWSDQPASTLTRFVGVNRLNSNIALASETQMFLYDAATGTLKGKTALSEVVNTSPVIVGDTAVFGTATGRGLGHLVTRGFRAWSSGLGGSIDAAPVLLTADGPAGLVSKSGEVAIVDPMTGIATGRAKLFAGPGAALAHSPTLLFVASLDHSLYAIAPSGQIVWRHRTDAPLRQAPMFHDNRVYCDLGESGGMTAFDATTGKVIWNNQEVSGRIFALRKGKLVGFDGARGYTLDPRKGLLIDRVDLVGVSAIRTEGFADAPVFVASSGGVITRLVPR
jgi:outer membrane protein assembly factor BamB